MNERTQPSAATAEAEPIEMVSADGTLSFRLRRVLSGVAIERRHGQGAFGSFASWIIVESVEQLVACPDIDALRFMDPWVHAQLMRNFVDVLDRPCPAAPGC